MKKRLFFGLMALSMQVFLLGCKTTNQKQNATNDDIDTQLNVVASFIDAGTPDKALREIRPLLDAHPDDARVQNMMGLTQLSLRNLNRSVEHFKKSFFLEEKISTGLNLSAAYIEIGKYSDAEKLLKRLTTMKEDPPYQYPERIYHNLGIVYERTNRAHLAEKNYKRALEESPIYYMAQVNLARLYENTKRINLAISTMEQAHSNCPVCLEPVTDLAKNYIRTKNPDKAKNILSQYVKTDGVTIENRAKATEMQKDLEKSVPKEPLSTNSKR